MTYLIAISTTNNKTWERPNWTVVTEKNTLDLAVSVFNTFVDYAETGDTPSMFFGIPVKVTQVAIFKYAGGDTFHRKPTRYHDHRDKSEWLISGAGDLINYVNSDFTINK